MNVDALNPEQRARAERLLREIHELEIQEAQLKAAEDPTAHAGLAGAKVSLPARDVVAIKSRRRALRAALKGIVEGSDGQAG